MPIPVNMGRTAVIAGIAAVAAGTATYALRQDRPDYKNDSFGLGAAAAFGTILPAFGALIGSQSGAAWGARLMRGSIMVSVGAAAAGVGAIVGNKIANARNGQFDNVAYANRTLSEGSTTLATGGPEHLHGSLGGYGVHREIAFNSLDEMKRSYGMNDLADRYLGHNYGNPIAPYWDPQVLIRDKDTRLHAYNLKGDPKDVATADPKDLGTDVAVVTKDGIWQPSADGSHFELAVKRADFLSPAQRANILDSWNSTD
jgi:hypothetical protein